MSPVITFKWLGVLFVFTLFESGIGTFVDLEFLDVSALARCGGAVSTAKLQTALGKKGSAIQPYRKRLIEAGIIEASRRGELVFAVPYLADYLLEKKK